MNDRVNLATAVEFQGEIARLRAEIERLRGYRDLAEADRAVAMVAAERLRLTDAEREAIARAAETLATAAESRGDIQTAWYLVEDAATLRGLLERTG